MNNVMTIAGNELRRIFVSPLAWSVLGVVQLILGFVFLMLLIDYATTRRSRWTSTPVWPTSSAPASTASR